MKIETYRALGALDEMRLIVLPLLIGQGLRLTPSLNLKTRLELKEARPMATGAVELIYACQ